MKIEDEFENRGSEDPGAERKAPEETILKSLASLEPFQWVFEQNPMGMGIVGRDHRFLRINESFCRMLEYREDELIGRTYADITHPEDREKSRHQAKRLFTGRTAGYQMLKRYVSKSGRVIWVNLIVTHLEDERGRPQHGLGIVEDITERKKAEEEILASHEQLRSLAAHLQHIREEERTAIAREIHDELGQNLTAIKMDLAWLGEKLRARRPALARRTDEMSKLTDATIQTVRRISTTLRPSVLDTLGLVPAVEWLAHDLESRTGIQCRLETALDRLDLPEEASTQIFRLFQEALTNVARHSGARRVRMKLARDDGHISMEVRDDGRGIDETEIGNTKSLGLLGMRERARLLGGEIEFEGRPSGGTTVRLRFPLPLTGDLRGSSS